MGLSAIGAGTQRHPGSITTSGPMSMPYRSILSDGLIRAYLVIYRRIVCVKHLDADQPCIAGHIVGSHRSIDAKHHKITLGWRAGTSDGCTLRAGMLVVLR